MSAHLCSRGFVDLVRPDGIGFPPKEGIRWVVCCVALQHVVSGECIMYWMCCAEQCFCLMFLFLGNARFCSGCMPEHAATSASWQVQRPFCVCFGQSLATFLATRPW